MALALLPTLAGLLPPCNSGMDASSSLHHTELSFGIVVRC